MKPWQFALVCLACLAVAGCRSDPRIETLERELRLQEDEIYRLRDRLADVPDSQDFQGSKDSKESPPSHLELNIEPGEISGPDALGEDALPTYEPPSDPEADAPSAEPSLPRQQDPDDVPEGPEAGGPLLHPDNRQVSEVRLDRRLSGGYNADGRPGDEGITAVIEAHGPQGQPVKAAAAVSIVALDPELEGEAARVGRWDFTAAEIAERFRRNGRGIRLKMPWPAALPLHDELLLYVRYTTDDGRQLQTNELIQVDLPDERTAGWVRSEPPVAEEPVDPPAQLPGDPAARQISARPLPPSPHPVEPESRRPVWSPDRQ